MLDATSLLIIAGTFLIACFNVPGWVSTLAVTVGAYANPGNCADLLNAQKKAALQRIYESQRLDLGAMHR